MLTFLFPRSISGRLPQCAQAERTANGLGFGVYSLLFSAASFLYLLQLEFLESTLVHGFRVSDGLQQYCAIML